MDLVGGIAAAGNALGIAKSLRDIDKAYDAATYRARIADLVDELTDAKLALVEAKDELASKDREIAELKAAANQAKSLTRGDGDYQFFANANGERSGFPACPSCLAVGRVIQMKQNINIDAAKCPSCKEEFRPVTNYIPASENGGSETTAVDRHNAHLRETRRQRSEQLARANSSRSWMD